MNQFVIKLFQQFSLYPAAVNLVLNHLADTVDDEGVAALVRDSWTQLTETLLLCQNIEIRGNLSKLLSSFRLHIS